MPARIEQSDFFRRLVGSRLRWSPERLTLGAGFYKQERNSFQFGSVLDLPNDSTRAIESPRHGLENDAQISFAPFEPLRATFSLRSTRDLLPTIRASNQRETQSAIDQARRSLGGLDIGWETNRTMATELSYRPEIASWLRPLFNYSARFGTDRHPSYLERLPDSTALMQRRFQADRQLNRGLMLDPGGFLRALQGMPQEAPDSVLASRGTFSRLTYRLGNAFRPIELNWNSALGSQFERELIQPGFGYQVGLGAFDAFRLIGGDTAVYVNARNAFSARSAIRLPFNTELDASFEENTLDAVDQRGGEREQVDRRWPQVHMRWNRLPLPGFLSNIIVSSTLSAGYERSKQRSLLGGLDDQARGGRDTRVPLSVVLGFANGFSASYTGSLSAGETNDPTGNAEQSGIDHALTLVGVFQPPESWQPKVSAPITANLSLRQTSQRNCRFQSALTGVQLGEDCIAFIDFQNRTANFILETVLSDLRLGFQLSYSSRQSFVGTHNGTSQFQLGLFGNFQMKAGRELQGPSGIR
jgi:hypothetical protein